MKKESEIKAQKDDISNKKDLKPADKQKYEKEMQAKVDQALKQER